MYTLSWNVLSENISTMSVQNSSNIFACIFIPKILTLHEAYCVLNSRAWAIVKVIRSGGVNFIEEKSIFIIWMFSLPTLTVNKDITLCHREEQSEQRAWNHFKVSLKVRKLFCSIPYNFFCYWFLLAFSKLFIFIDEMSKSFTETSNE